MRRGIMQVSIVAAVLLALGGCNKQAEEAMKKQGEELTKVKADAAKADAAAKAELAKANEAAAAAKADLDKATAEVDGLKNAADKAKADFAACEQAGAEAAKAKADLEKAGADCAAALEKCKAELSPPPAPADAIKAAITGLMQAQYAAIDKGDVDGWAVGLAPDVFFIGSAATEAIAGKDAVVADLKAVFGPALQNGGKFATKSAGLVIGVSPDLKAAWVADELEITITIGDQVMPLPFRITELFVEKDGQWLVVATAWSHAMSDADAFKAVGEGKLPAPAAIADQIDAGAEPLAEAFNATVNDVNAFLATIPDRDDAFVFGTAAEEKIPGGANIKAAFGQLVQALSVTTTKNGGVRAGIAPSGTTGYIAANLDFGATVEGNKVTVPYRFMGVYINEEGAWKLVQVHFSIGMAQQQ